VIVGSAGGIVCSTTGFTCGGQQFTILDSVKLAFSKSCHQVLRLKYELHRSNREIGLSCGIGSNTVGDYIRRARNAGLNRPLSEELSDTTLEQLLLPLPTPRNSARLFLEFHEVHKGLQSHKKVTLNLLWQEYKERNPDGYQYSWYCHNYRDWAARGER